jgi:hypothetical protein
VTAEGDSNHGLVGCGRSGRSGAIRDAAIRS